MADVTSVDVTAESSVDEQIRQFRSSRWFERGWTLQELIACQKRQFYTRNWSRIDSDAWKFSIEEVIVAVTGISVKVLHDPEELRECCIAERMSWAARRETTRPEDLAYCLMGIFSVNMAILYGEGLHGAFRRLQDEIMKISFDQTLFAWRGQYESSGLLAHSPRDFVDTPQLGLWGPEYLAPIVSTNLGILWRPCIIRDGSTDNFPARDGIHDDFAAADEPGVVKVALQCEVKIDNTWKALVLYMKPVSMANCFAYGQRREAFRRVRCNSWKSIHSNDLEGRKFVDVLVLEDESYHLVLTSTRHNETRWRERHSLVGTSDQQEGHMHQESTKRMKIVLEEHYLSASKLLKYLHERFGNLDFKIKSRNGRFEFEAPRDLTADEYKDLMSGFPRS